MVDLARVGEMMERARSAWAAAMEDVAVFHGLCERGEFASAERFRDRAVAQVEASLDTMATAHRAIVEASR